MLLDLDGLVRVSDNLDREYLGIVVSNDDDKKLGRVKCSIAGLLEGEASDLPFVHSIVNPDFFIVPKVGDQLRIVFRQGDIYFPEYKGYWHLPSNHNAEFDTDYPNSYGLARDGFKIKYNKTSGLFEIQTPEGAYMEINKDGDVKFKSKKDFIVDSDGKVTFTSVGDVSMSSNGMATFKGMSGTNIGDSASVTNVNGSSVLLGGGGLPVAILGSIAVGIGNHGAPVVSPIVGNVSSKVSAAL